MLWLCWLTAVSAHAIALDAISNNSNSSAVPVFAASIRDGFQEYTLSKRSMLNPATMKYICKYNPRAILKFRDTGTVMVPDEALWSVAAKTFQYYEVKMENEERDNDEDNNDNDSSDEKETDEYPLFPASNCILVSDSDGSSGSISLQYTVKLTVLPHSTVASNWVVSTLAFKHGSTIPLGSTSGSWSGIHTCTAEKGMSTRLMYKAPLQQLKSTARAITYNRMSNSVTQLGWTPFPAVTWISTRLPVFYCVSWPSNRCGRDPGVFTDKAGTQFAALMQ